LKSLILKIGAFRSINVVNSSRAYVRRARNPGIDRRLKLFSKEFIEEEDPDEMFETVEADFFNVQEAHKQFEKEEGEHKEMVHSMIVGQKYFREKGINFLTWSEKEQIRFLSHERPKEWDEEKLSQSFPADLYTIRKIIRNKWLPKDEKNVQRHDESVKRNWQKFRAGELEVEPVLADHLKRFAHRDFNEVARPSVNRTLGVEVPKPMSSEFSSIITTCKKFADGEKENQPKETKKEKLLRLKSNELAFPENRPSDPEKDTVVLEGDSRNTMKWVTLKEYEKSSPELALKREHLQANIPAPPGSVSTLKTLKHQENAVATLTADETKVFRSLDIKEQIFIPKKVWKKDKLYKVGDCFYADDGEFLYRVPGL